MSNQYRFVLAGIGGGVVAALFSLVSNITGVLVPSFQCILIPRLCATWLVLPIVVGYWAAAIDKTQKGKFTRAAFVGAISGVIMAVMFGFMNVCVTLLLQVIDFTPRSAFMPMGGPTQLDSIDTIGTDYFIVGAMIGLVVLSILSAGFGALGGVIKAAMDNGGSSTAPPKVEEAEVVS